MWAHTRSCPVSGHTTEQGRPWETQTGWPKSSQKYIALEWLILLPWSSGRGQRSADRIQVCSTTVWPLLPHVPATGPGWSQSSCEMLELHAAHHTCAYSTLLETAMPYSALRPALFQGLRERKIIIKGVLSIFSQHLLTGTLCPSLTPDILTRQLCASLADRANFNTSTGTKFKTKISRLQKQLWALSSSFTTLRKSVFAHFIAKRGRNGGPVSASVDPQAATAWEFSWSEPQSGCSSTLSGVPAATFRLALLLFPLRCFQRCCSRRQHRQPARNTPAMPSSTAASQETALSKSNLSPQQPLPGYERLTMLLHSWN